jgi:TctA family transporter
MKKVVKASEKFGTGIPEGVAGPEMPIILMSAER